MRRLEAGTLGLKDVDEPSFFDLVLSNTREGFLADPAYGGNRDMAGWKMIGFPGPRYDYRDYIGKLNQPLGLEPVGLLRRPAWTPG